MNKHVCPVNAYGNLSTETCYECRSTDNETCTVEENFFSETDYSVVRGVLGVLPLLQQRIVKMKFWDGITIPEIGVLLNVSDHQVYAELKDALEMLKELCLDDPSFSRSLAQLQAA